MSTPLYINNSDNISTDEKVSALIGVCNAMSTILYQNGVKDLPEEFDNIKVIVANVAPTTETVGILGQFYIHNTGTNNNLYFCSAIAEDSYTWTRVNASGGGSGGGDADTLEGHPAVYFAQMVDSTLQGTPTAPTAAKGTNTDQIATTKFVQKQLQDYTDTDSLAAGYAPLNNAHLTGNPTSPTPTASTNSDRIATTSYVQTNLALYARKASPAFEGAPTAPTAPTGTNTQQIATTAFANAAAQAAVANVRSGYIQCKAIDSTTQEWMSNGFFLYNPDTPWQFIVPSACHIRVTAEWQTALYGTLNILKNDVIQYSVRSCKRSGNDGLPASPSIIINCSANDTIKCTITDSYGDWDTIDIMIAERLNW